MPSPPLSPAALDALEQRLHLRVVIADALIEECQAEQDDPCHLCDERRKDRAALADALTALRQLRAADRPTTEGHENAVLRYVMGSDDHDRIITDLERARRELAEARAVIEAVTVALEGHGGVTDFELTLPPVRRVVDALAALNRSNALQTLLESDLDLAHAEIARLRSDVSEWDRRNRTQAKIIADFSSRLAAEQAETARLREELNDALITTRNYYAQAISRADLEKHQVRWKAALQTPYQPTIDLPDKHPLRIRAEAAESALTDLQARHDKYQQAVALLHDALVGKGMAGAFNHDLCEQGIRLFDEAEAERGIGHPEDITEIRSFRDKFTDLQAQIRGLVKKWEDQAGRVRPLECAPVSAQKRERTAEWMMLKNRAAELAKLLPSAPEPPDQR